MGTATRAHSRIPICNLSAAIILGIFDKLDEGLKDLYPCSIERIRIIITECIYFGDIKPYTIFDTHLGYEINKFTKVNFTVSNLLNNRHTEIVGGPSLGRVFLIRLNTKF